MDPSIISNIFSDDFREKLGIVSNDELLCSYLENAVERLYQAEKEKPKERYIFTAIRWFQKA